MEEMTTETCGFPGCERPTAPASEGAGRPSRYCDLTEHNAQSAFRERKRRADAGEGDGGEASESGGDRPVSLAAASLRSIASRLAVDLERTRDVVTVLRDTEQLEAELAAVRADTQAEVSQAAQLEAAARRDRLEADEAAEAALKAAEEAQDLATAASERERDAEARERDAQAVAEEAGRAAQDAIARAEAALAAQAAAEASTAKATSRSEEAEARAEQAQAERASALAAAKQAEQERDSALAQARDAELERRGAEREAERARTEAERAERLATEAERRAAGAEERAAAALQRADVAEQRARDDRAALEGELAEQRVGWQAAELERGRAQVALEGEQRLRAQLEKDLETCQQRVVAAEKAREAAIKTLEQAATRGTSPRGK